MSEKYKILLRNNKSFSSLCGTKKNIEFYLNGLENGKVHGSGTDKKFRTVFKKKRKQLSRYS